jgi:4'-phosphopantetheinyl transferase
MESPGVAVIVEDGRACRVGEILRLSEAVAIPDARHDGPLALALAPGGVDVWLCFYDTLDAPAWRDAFAALLTPEERARHDRLGSSQQQLAFLAGAALCRHVLSRYAPVNPAAWRFVAGEHGKPHIATPPVEPALWFNLSGTRGLVACAVSRATPTVGVDVEVVEPTADMLDVAAQFFSTSEAQALRALPPQEQPERFLTLWTLKESYVKARGLGIAAVSLQDVAFDIRTDGSIGLALAPSLGDEAAGWHFASIRVSAHHLLAVAARLAGAATLRLRVATWVPDPLRS